jgi:diguanylate cyclase (GGDEF)-like protein/PAS domain S-box-containing protein
MLKLTPAVRITLGIVALTLGLLAFADLLGFIPDSKRSVIEQRQRLSEMVSIQVAMAVKNQNFLAVQGLVWSTVERNDDVVSAAVRRRDGVLMASHGDHEQHWNVNKGSTPTQISLPVSQGEGTSGNLELTFTPIDSSTALGFLSKGILGLSIFVLLFGSMGYWFFLRRSLKYLDPSSAIPARVRLAMNVLNNGVLILDEKGQIVLANDSISEKLGETPDSLIGKTPTVLPWILPEKDGSLFVLPWRETLATGTEKTGIQFGLEGKDGKNYRFLVNSSPIMDIDGKQRGAIVGFDDITEIESKNRLLKKSVQELKESQRQIEEKNAQLHIMATRDPMTNCHNRRSLYSSVEPMFAEAKATGETLSCIMTDIDHFKSVNDTYGHSAGDEIIKMVASTLLNIIGEDHIVCRYGGEEFCIILNGVGIFEAKRFAERCRTKIESQITSGISVTSSFGVTTLKYGAESIDELISQADEALYKSKENGRNCVSSWEKAKGTDKGASKAV